ncbi:hypothetical protein [Corallincola spongiicola]|uniref:Uncharacterized protein n=1 Tax=Corallincola spongiicola TaxID=2520508 RepID=A0ABY1WLN3_9GAMM|nr:hypothetical protein [Corallincola spongiicola]TAA41810.1 hypothetical protein EXY25_16375 [Corallincola spongiicola]
MIKISRSSIILTVVMLAYIAWSQVALYLKEEALAIEKARVLSIADHLEFWKHTFLQQHAAIDVEALKGGVRNVQLTLIEQEAPIQDKQDKVYVMYYNAPTDEQLTALQRYQSELVLSRYFYLVVNENGQVTETFWDKP